MISNMIHNIHMIKTNQWPKESTVPKVRLERNFSGEMGSS